MKSSAVLFVASLLCCIFTPTLSARIGDKQSELESRLKQSRKGLRITDGDLLEFHRNRSPIGKYQQYLPDVDYALYFKTTNDLIPTSKGLWEEDPRGRGDEKPVAKPEGWLLQVLYLNGVSTMEFYQRSQPLTLVEKNAILSLSQADSEWRMGRVPKEEVAAIQPTIFSQNHYRVDFAVYANVEGDSILLYDPRLDQMIRERELDLARQLAPSSIEGF